MYGDNDETAGSPGAGGGEGAGGGGGVSLSERIPAMAEALKAAKDEVRKIDEEEKSSAGGSSGSEGAGEGSGAGDAGAGEGADAKAGEDAGAAAGADGAGSEKPEGEEAGAGAPAKFTFRARGAERSFDLTKKEDIEELQRLANKGANHDALLEEYDDKVQKRVDEWGVKSGLSIVDKDGNVVPTVEGALGLALKIAKMNGLDPSAVHAAAAKILPAAAPAEDDLTGLEADLDEDNPEDKRTLALIRGMRSLKNENASLRNQIKESVAPLQERFQTEDQRRAAAQSAEVGKNREKHHDTEIQKYKVLAGLKDKDLTRAKAHMLADARQAIAEGRAKTPEEALTLATKEYAALRGGGAPEKRAAAEAAAAGMRPRPAGSPPGGAGGSGGVPSPATQPGNKPSQSLSGQSRERGMAAYLRKIRGAG